MTRRTGLLLAAGLAVALGIVGGAALWASVRRAGEEEAASAFRITRLEPAVAPAIELPDLSGQKVRLVDLRGRVVLVNFWATWCAPCREEMPALESLWRELGPQGLTIVAVNHKEPVALVTAFVREYGLTFPVLLDAEGASAARYRVVGLPATFFVDRTGNLTGAALGLRDWVGPGARAYLGRLLTVRS